MRGSVLLCLLLSGCALFAVHQPGSGVTKSFAARWNCSYETVMGEAERAKADLPSGSLWVPQVGWTACKLLGRTGAPQDVDLQQSAYGRSASWWYRSGSSGSTHLVTLELQTEGTLRGQWVVDYVGW